MVRLKNQQSLTKFCSWFHSKFAVWQNFYTWQHCLLVIKKVLKSNQPKKTSRVWRQTQSWKTIVTTIILDLDRECVVRLLKSHQIMINYFRTGMALEVQWKKNFQYMYIFASKFLCIPMNISSKPAHSQFIWSKKEPARNKGSQKLFVTVYKKQNTK